MENLHIGEKAPRFRGNSTMGDIKLSDYLGKWVVLFSNMEDFTPVDTTEIIAMSRLSQEFESRNCKIIGLSRNSNSSQLSWINDIERITGVPVNFPIIEDLNNKDEQDLKSVLILDPTQTVRLILMYPKNVGVNVNEILRCIDALEESDKSNTEIPANWILGNPTVTKAPNNHLDMYKRSSNVKPLTWYLCFNNMT